MSNWEEFRNFISQFAEVQHRADDAFIIYVNTTAGRSQTLLFRQFPHFVKVLSPVAQTGQVSLDQLLLSTPLFGVGTTGNDVYGLIHVISFAGINYATLMPDIQLLASTADELEQMILGTDDW